MEENRIRKLFCSGKLAFGITIQQPLVAMIDMVAWAGYDYVVIDLEHGPFGIEVLENMVRAAEAHRLPTLVRVPHPDPFLVSKVLDTGADGIKLAHCSSRQEAEAIVRQCRLRPTGVRGACMMSREAKYQLMPIQDYVRHASQAAIVVLIEDKEGLEQAEQILNVAGIDAIEVGTIDLSISQSGSINDPLVPVSFEEPAVLTAQEHVKQLAKSAGVNYIQSACRTPERVEEWLKRDKDLHIFLQSTDTLLISRGLQSYIQSSRKIAAQIVKG